MNIKDGGAAFPQSGFDMWAPEGGMTLRDYFAACFMQGRAAVPGFVDVEIDAKRAYEQADAMLAERIK